MDLNKLETRDLGRYFEQLLASKFIKLGFEVFTPVVDKGVDIILRKEDNDQTRYFEIQAKSVRRKGERLTIRRDTFSPSRKNLFLIFFNVKSDENYDAYLIPLTDVCRILQKQEQRRKPIYRLYTTESDLEKIRDYKWNMDEMPEVWKN